MTWIRNCGGAALIAPSPPPAPAPPPSGVSSNRQTIVNLSGVSDYGGFQPFINIIKGSSRTWTDPAAGNADVAQGDARMNANYEPASLGAGNSMDRLQFIDTSLIKTDYPFAKTGDHVLKWDGAGDLVPNNASTLTSAGRRTWNMTVSSFYYLTFRATGPVSNIRFCHVDHEAALDAGVEILTPEFVSWLQSWTNAKAFRFLDFMSGNFGTQAVAADWRSLSYISWCTQEWGVPPEVIGEVGRKTGRPLWVVAPRLANDACLTALYQRMKDRDPTGTNSIIVESGNESWNGGFPVSSYLANGAYQALWGNAVKNSSGGAGSGTQDTLNSCYAHFSMRCWKAADAVFGTSRVWPTGGGQTGFPAYLEYWISYTDSSLYGGATPVSILNTRGQLSLSHYWGATTTAPNNVTFKQACISDYGNRTDLQWTNDWKASMDTMVTNEWQVCISLAQARGYTGPFNFYEGGCNDFIDANDSSTNAWGNFVGTVNTGDNTLDMGADGVAWLSNGDNLRTLFASPGTGLNNYGTWCFGRIVPSTTKIRLYPTQADALADTNVGTLTAGTYSMSNLTRHIRIQEKVYSLLQGTRGDEIAQYVVTKAQTTGVNIRSLAFFAGPAIARAGINVVRYVYSFDGYGRGVLSISTECAGVQYMKALNQVGSP